MLMGPQTNLLERPAASSEAATLVLVPDTASTAPSHAAVLPFKAPPASQHQQHLRVIIFEIPTGGNTENKSGGSEHISSAYTIEEVPDFTPGKRLNATFRSSPLYRLFEVYRT